MSPIDAVIEMVVEGVAAAGRFVWDLPKLPARRREARRLAREAEDRRRAEHDAAGREAAARQALVGRQAIVVRPLKRSGLIEVDGATYEAMSEAGFVEAGAAVVVVGWDGRFYQVRLPAEAP
jgi:hypothetical protein